MRVLVLGGYGFIGLDASRRLLEAGHEVVALGRSIERGRRALPGAAWLSADIATLDTPERSPSHASRPARYASMTAS